MTHQGDTNKACEACAAHAATTAVEIGRRTFIGMLLGAGATLIGAIIGTPVLRYVLYPVYASTAHTGWSDLGDVNEFKTIQGPVSKTVAFVQRDGWREVVSTQSVYVNRKPDGQLHVMSAICPHLGCSVAWQASQNKFVCPCHGGQFQADGTHISGPPPRRMDSLEAQVKDGKLQVQFKYFRSNVPDQESLS